MRKTACLLMLVAGCGAQVDMAAARTSARSTCEASNYTMQEIDDLFLWARTSRTAGFTLAEMLAAANRSCIIDSQALLIFYGSDAWPTFREDCGRCTQVILVAEY